MIKELLFYGNDVQVHDFPQDIDIIYPKSSVEPVKSAAEIIGEAIDSNSQALEVDKDSRVVIAFDDVSVPLPLQRDDCRRVMASEVLKRLNVPKDNILFICATGLHRKCARSELNEMLGELASEYKTINHDCFDTVSLGETDSGYKVDINKYAAEADLLVYLSVPYLPMNGGWKSVAVGLGSYDSIRQHHTPKVLNKSSYMDTGSKFHEMVAEIGRKIAEQVKIYQVEAVLNNDFSSGIFRHIWGKLYGEYSISQDAILRMLRLMPEGVKSSFRKRHRSDYKVVHASAGNPDSVHTDALKKIREQRTVNVGGKYDALIFGLPNLTPYNVNSEMNPILFHTTVRGYLYNMFEKVLKDDAVFVVQNPLHEVFDEVQHPAYKQLYYQYILKGRTSFEELAKAEKELIADKRLLNAYRNGIAYHPAHSVIAYYWGSLGQKGVDVIVSGAAGNAEAIGCEKALSIDESFKKLREKGVNQIGYAAIPPIFLAEP